MSPKFFFRPTPSWLSPGRYTRSTAAKELNCKLACKAVRTGRQPQKQTEPKKKQTNKPKTTQQQPKQTKQKQKSGIATSNGTYMHDDILCPSVSKVAGGWRSFSGVLKVSGRGVALWALRNLATSVSMIWSCFKVM